MRRLKTLPKAIPAPSLRTEGGGAVFCEGIVKSGWIDEVFRRVSLRQSKLSVATQMTVVLIAPTPLIDRVARGSVQCVFRDEL